jgi:hypothetical protein
MCCSRQENKPAIISYFLFCPSSTICIPPLSSTIFIYSFSIAYLFIASLHIIKSKIFKKKLIELWKKMKGICFTFDAFGQWGEYERSKMWCRMKVGVEWRPSVAARQKIYARPATIPLFSLLSLLLYSSLSQPPHLGDKLESFWPHGLAARPPTLASWPDLGFPIKELPRGASSFIP